jgi:hypothetical protein
VAQGHGWIGHLARRFHLTEWVQRNAPNLEALGAKLARPALTFGKGAVSMLATLAGHRAGRTAGRRRPRLSRIGAYIAPVNITRAATAFTLAGSRSGLS